LKISKDNNNHDDHIAGSGINIVSIIAGMMLTIFIISIITLLIADVTYEHFKFSAILNMLKTPSVRFAIKLSLITSILTLILVVIVAVPTGYALSRFKFPGRSVADMIVDLPIVLPPIIIGVSLLVFFSTDFGKFLHTWIENHGSWADHIGINAKATIGIVLCQFFVSVSYTIRACKAAFDSVDRRLEQTAMTLGATNWQTFWRISLPLARNGLIAGAVMSWARAIGVFGPIIVLVGTMAFSAEVLPSTIQVRMSVGEMEVGIAAAMIMVVFATIALTIVHWLTPNRKWN